MLDKTALSIRSAIIVRTNNNSKSIVVPTVIVLSVIYPRFPMSYLVLLPLQRQIWRISMGSGMKEGTTKAKAKTKSKDYGWLDDSPALFVDKS
jgi:hypothetical protein